jgi:hypothetical protein
MAALAEANLRIATSGMEQEWENVRFALMHFMEFASTEERVKHPDVQESLRSANAFYEEARRQEDEQQAEIDRESMQLQKDAEIEAKKAEKELALETKKAEIEAKKEAKRQAAEIKRASQEARARELKVKHVKNKEDDRLCKSYGARVGSEEYISCRIQLSKESVTKKEPAVKNSDDSLLSIDASLEEAKKLRETQEKIVEQQKQMIEAQRLSEEKANAQKQADQNNEISSALMELGFGLMMGGSASPVQTQRPSVMRFLKHEWWSSGNHMCKYDDGSVVNVGVNVCSPTKN